MFFIQIISSFRVELGEYAFQEFMALFFEHKFWGETCIG